MLSGLSIRNVVLIESLDLSFSEGLTTLTGETGAGKSILLDALGLALGVRSDSRFIRAGANQASVTATFDLPSQHPVLPILEEQGLEQPEEGLILRRILGKDGRSKAFVNDRPVGISLLKSLGAMLVEVHGQFDQVGLLDSTTHRQVLDAYGGHGGLIVETSDAWQTWATAREALQNAEQGAENARRDEDYLRHVHRELADLAPDAGEEPKLTAERSHLANGGKILESVRAIIDAIGPESRADQALGDAAKALEKGAALAPDLFEAATAALDRAGIELSELYTAAVGMTHDVEAEPERLQQVDDRLAALRDAARKHRCDVEQLPPLLECVSEKLSAIDNQSDALAHLKQEADTAALAYQSKARELSRTRHAAAEKLDEAVARELPTLKLDRTRFFARVSTQEKHQAAAHGLNKVRFEVATNPGAEPGPLGRIASSGELARIMLALKVVLAQDDGATAMIFDEVDAGVGGATAAAVGERLARLGEESQVLVVTHAPQVAAKARQHWRVSKAATEDTAVTRVELLDEQERREEIARMLSGASITDEARAAATALMATG